MNLSEFTTNLPPTKILIKKSPFENKNQRHFHQRSQTFGLSTWKAVSASLPLSISWPNYCSQRVFSYLSPHFILSHSFLFDRLQRAARPRVYTHRCCQGVYCLSSKLHTATTQQNQSADIQSPSKGKWKRFHRLRTQFRSFEQLPARLARKARARDCSSQLSLINDKDHQW